LYKASCSNIFNSQTAQSVENTCLRFYHTRTLATEGLFVEIIARDCNCQTLLLKTQKGLERMWKELVVV